MRDREFNFDAEGELNSPSKDEFHLPRENVSTAVPAVSEKKRGSGTRRRAMIQLAAALTAVVLVTDAFGMDLLAENEPELSPPPPSADIITGPGQEQEELTANPAPAVEEETDYLDLTPEQKAFLDAMYAACLAEDGDELYRLVDLPVAEELEKCYYDGERASASRHGYEAMTMGLSLVTGHTMHVWFFYTGDSFETPGYEELIFSCHLSNSFDIRHITVDEFDSELGSWSRCHGYVRTKGFVELYGDFVWGAQSAEHPDSQMSFLENGTGTFYGDSNPIPFEVVDGYLQPNGSFNVVTHSFEAGEMVFLEYDYGEGATGIAANWPEDPYYHTYYQMAY